MKAEMSEDGVITLSPETGAEAFALCHWLDVSLVAVSDPSRNEEFYFRGSKIIVVGKIIEGKV